MGMDRLVFRDAVALRMGLDPPDPLPTHCPSCGEKFTLAHALECKRGGWVTRRHNEVIRAWMQYFKKGGAVSVHAEPLLRPLPKGTIPRPGTTKADDARADIVVRGADGRDHFYDVAVIDSYAHSYMSKSALKPLTDYEHKKIAMYEDRVSPMGSFTPLISSVYGTLAPAAATTANQVARGVDPDREERDATLDLHQAVLQAAVIKATGLCLRGRGWSVLPRSGASGSLEDAAALVAGAREKE